MYGADYGRRDQTTCAYRRFSFLTRNTLCSGPTGKVAELYVYKTCWFQHTCEKNHSKTWNESRYCLSTGVMERTGARSELAAHCLKTPVRRPISTWSWLTPVNVRFSGLHLNQLVWYESWFCPCNMHLNHRLSLFSSKPFSSFSDPVIVPYEHYSPEWNYSHFFKLMLPIRTKQQTKTYKKAILTENDILPTTHDSIWWRLIFFLSGACI